MRIRVRIVQVPLPTLPKAVMASTLRRAVVYNTERPHQALGMHPSIDRFVLAAKAAADLEVIDPIPVAIPGQRQPQRDRRIQAVNATGAV